MSIPAHGAIVRGDDYQYAIGLYRAAQLLTDPTYESVSVEDKAGGAFDDIVLRPTVSSGRPIECDQVKSGNFNAAVIDGNWMLAKASEGGRSPLQHFYATWADFVAAGQSVLLRLISNKNFDQGDALLRFISHTTDRISKDTLDGLGPRSAGGRQLKGWADHLGISVEEAKQFLREISFVRSPSETDWRRNAGSMLVNAGFQGDDVATSLGVEMVREWVKEGVGPRSRDDVRSELARRNLLARGSQLVLAVHGIDRSRLPQPPNATVDIVDLYDGDDPFSRRLLKDPTAWTTEVLPALKAVKADLEGFGTRNLHLEASMRLSMYFAVGRTFPGVGRWVLSSEQRGVIWSTDAASHHAGDVVTLADVELNLGDDLAVVIALTSDPTEDVVEYLRSQQLSVHTVLTLSSAEGPSPSSVAGPGWALDWARKAREQVRRRAREIDAGRVHMFMAAPAGAALFLGHDWNQVPETVLYDHVRDNVYAPTITLPG